jgi:hypothetical protein
MCHLLLLLPTIVVQAAVPLVVESLPDEVAKELRKLCDSYVKDTLRRLRVEAHMAKKTEDMAVLSGEKGYPHGHKPFKSPASFAQLDLPVTSALHED